MFRLNNKGQAVNSLTLIAWLFRQPSSGKTDTQTLFDDWWIQSARQFRGWLLSVPSMAGPTVLGSTSFDVSPLPCSSKAPATTISGIRRMISLNAPWQKTGPLREFVQVGGRCLGKKWYGPVVDITYMQSGHDDDSKWSGTIYCIRKVSILFQSHSRYMQFEKPCCTIWLYFTRYLVCYDLILSTFKKTP